MTASALPLGYPNEVAFDIDVAPELHHPVAILAFAGWNDAASAATNAARLIVRRLAARRFASLSAEEFYCFTDTRPTVRPGPGGGRIIDWPTNEYFYARNPTGPHDIVVSIGIEPNLRWKTFVGAHIELLQSLNVETVITLGALLADVPHTRPVRVTGAVQDPRLGAAVNVRPSRYRGPTGIVGVMGRALLDAEIPAGSFWANVPHYITAAQNPPATVALLDRLEEAIGLKLDHGELTRAGGQFETEVSTALSANPEISDYVRRLEEAYDNGDDDQDSPTDPSDEDEPNPGQILRDVEDFLRQARLGDDPGDDNS